MIVRTAKELNDVCRKIENSDEICLDTETHDRGYPNIDLVGTAISWDGVDACYIPTGHERGNQLPEELVLEKLGMVIPGKMTVMHNAKYDTQVIDLALRRNGLWDKPEIAWWTPETVYDTMIASWLLDTESPHGLKPLSYRYLNDVMVELEDFCPWEWDPRDGGKKNNKIFLTHKTDIEEMGRYASADVINPLQLKNRHFDKMLEKEGFHKVLKELEHPMLFVLAEMEKRGVKLNEPKLQEYFDTAPDMLAKLEKEIFAMRPNGEEFNINSTKQLNEVLFGELGIKPIGKRGKSGDFSTKADYMEIWAKQHEIAQKILDWRQLDKLIGTYLNGLHNRLGPDGRIRTRFNQILTTGRLSSSKPNLQNIPRPENDVFGLRSLFMAEEGKKLIVADYSQIELRILAHLSQDPEYLKAYRSGADIHSLTAKNLYGLDCSVDEVKKKYKELRSIAKTFNFGISYEASAPTLAQQTGVDERKIQKLMAQYFKRFSGIKKFVDASHAQAENYGFVRTITHRKRHLEPAMMKNPKTKRDWIVKNAWLRKAVNAQVQGSAADVMNIAMRNMHRRFIREGLFPETRLILQVHDEIMVEFPDDPKLEKYLMKLVAEEMNDVVKLSVPIIADLDSGYLWSDAK